MPQATFYTHVSDPAEFVLRLSRKAVTGGQPVLLWAEDEEQLQRLDADLWRLPPEGFLPHEIWQPDAALPHDVPLLLACGHTLPQLAGDWVVLNLSAQFWCDAPQPPARVLEIVAADVDSLADARERFRAYRAAGFAIEHHRMAG